MHILHLTQKDYKTSVWSGGTTTELFIWPKGADYAKREFSFRVSSATVDLEESDFTALPGVHRWIAPIRGGFTLTHPGKAPIVMGPLAFPYRFDGEEPTHCTGCATDFNLMLKDIQGELSICRNKTCVRPGISCFYALEDGVFRIGGEHPMAAGELLVVFCREKACMELGSAPVLVCWAEVDQWEDF